MDDAIQATVGPELRAQMEICLQDRQGRPGNQRLSGPEGCDDPEWGAGRLAATYPLAFAGREWELRLRATSAYPLSQRGWAAWVTLAVGLAMHIKSRQGPWPPSGFATTSAIPAAAHSLRAGWSLGLRPAKRCHG